MPVIIIELQTPKGGATMKPKIFAIMCIILLLVCLVACNNRDPNGDLITTGRKPFAKPDPSNPYDQKIENQTFEDSSTLNKCFDNVLCVYFTNTESLNNIFHDYVIEDFQKFDILKIAELETYYLNDVRSIISRGTSLSEKESALISKYNRSIRIEFNFHDYNKLIDYYHLLFKRPEVRFIDPDGVGLNWFAEPNDLQYQTHQDVAELIDLEEAWDHTTGSSSVKIGVLDSGVLGTHADLVGNPNTSLSGAFGSVTATFADEANLGTSVAGIIGATGDNGTGNLQKRTASSLSKDSHQLWLFLFYIDFVNTGYYNKITNTKRRCNYETKNLCNNVHNFIACLPCGMQQPRSKW